ncbi:MAG: NTP transferase domain-containing protein [Firmicutes bacterium]|nr:NTP transferase domain-containing protein [Bacillota bacterium]
MTRITAVIPAAGYSSRMGLLKPILPLADGLVLEKTIGTFTAGGISDILVVTGHKAELVAPVARRLGAAIVYNPEYDCGMYASVQAAARVLPQHTEAFFFLPADMPLVTPATIQKLVAVFAEKAPDVAYPVTGGKRGHPPLISAKLRPAILKEKKEGGLKALLQEHACSVSEVAVNDPGILQDLDTEDAYRKVVVPSLADFPTAAMCEEIWQKYQVPDGIIRHMRQVARAACLLAEHVNSGGLRIHTALLQAACLLHDLARGRPRHADIGRQIVTDLGYPAVGEVIGYHMDLPAVYTDKITEHSLLYLADKLTAGERFVSLEARIAAGEERFQNKPEALKMMRRRLQQAMLVSRQVAAVTKRSVEKILCGEAGIRE